MATEESTTLLQDLKCQVQNPTKLTSRAPPPSAPSRAARVPSAAVLILKSSCRLSRRAAFWGLKGSWNIFDTEASHCDVKNNMINVKLPSDFATSFLHLTHPASFQLVPLIIWAFEDLMNEQIRTGRGNAVFL